MKKCPSCQRVYNDSQIYCLEDGAMLAEETASGSTPTLLMPRRKNRLPFVFAALLLIVGASVAGWFLLGAKPQGANQNNRQANTGLQTPVPSPTLLPAAIATPMPVSISSPSPLPTASVETNANVSSNSETISNSKPADETNSAKQLPPAMKAEDHSVLFVLQQCRKSGTSITCDFSLTNKGQDRWFELVASSSSLYDELGNGYQGRNAQLANQQGSEPRIAFVSGVTTRAQITFEGIEPSAMKITLLIIQYDVGNDTALKLRFRNVPLIVSR